MEKLMKTSKTVDTILKVVYKILQVGGIIILVGVGICIIAGALGQLPPAELTSVSFGDVELIFAEPQIVDTSFMMIEMGTTLVMALIAIAVTCYLIKVLRKVLVPMTATSTHCLLSKEGRPISIPKQYPGFYDMLMKAL